MEIKVLLCNCKGLCDSFKDSDMNKLPFEVESDLDVKYTVLSPQLCGQGGNAILEEAMKAAKPDSYLLVGACAPKAQEKLFKKLIRATGFNEKHFVPVDIRGTDNAGILDRLREAVEGILKQAEAAPSPAGVTRSIGSTRRVHRWIRATFFSSMQVSVEVDGRPILHDVSLTIKPGRPTSSSGRMVRGKRRC